LVVQIGSVPAVLLAAPAVRALCAALPGAEIALLTGESTAEAAAVLPGVTEVIATQAIWQWRPGEAPVLPARTRALVELLRARRFDAAVILPDGAHSPYPAAYVCYLAGIPIRLGQSQEFGGGLLSPGIKPSTSAGRAADPGLALLAAAGFALDEPDRQRSQGMLDLSQATSLGDCDLPQGVPDLFGRAAAGPLPPDWAASRVVVLSREGEAR
jgi:ADP-heptose:LPS heptosyltransferase